MGVPKFFRWLSERYPKINQPFTSHPQWDRPTFYNPDGSPGLHVGRNSNTVAGMDGKEEEDGAVVEDDEEEVVEDIDEVVILPEFDRLYIDMNGIIHGCTHNNASQVLSPSTAKIISNDNSGTTTGATPTEEEIIYNVCRFLDRIVGDIVKPKELVYVAIDGVAPRAKLNQQRSRRYRAGKEKQIAAATAVTGVKTRKDEGDDGSPAASVLSSSTSSESLVRTEEGRFRGIINVEGGPDDGDVDGAINLGNSFSSSTITGNFTSEISDAVITDDDKEEGDGSEGGVHTISITPGTPFLEKVSRHVRYYIQHKIHHGDPAWKDLKVIYSGPEVAGEGEHKIMQFIRDEKHGEGYNPNTRHCIYGQDGDLVMLGLATHEPHMCLLREEVLFGPQREKSNVDIAMEAYRGGAGAAGDGTDNGEGGGSDSGSPTSAKKQSGSIAQVSVERYVSNARFELLHMSVLRDYIALEFETCNIFPDSPFHLEPTIDDFVFLTFFVGNDFLPPLPALDIADGAFDLLFFTYKKHRRYWLQNEQRLRNDNSMKKQRKKKKKGKGGGMNGSGEEDDVASSSSSSYYPYLTNAGKVVSGVRLERFLLDVGRHEDPVLNSKRDSEDFVNKRIRKEAVKAGRSSLIGTPDEIREQELEQREKYQEMLESVDVPVSQTFSGGDSSFTPVLSSGTLPRGIGRKRKHRAPKMTTQPEMSSDVDQSLMQKLSHLVLSSLSSENETATTQKLPRSTTDLVEADGTGAPVDESKESLTSVDGSAHGGGSPSEALGSHLKDIKGRYYYDKFEFTPVDSAKHKALRKAYVEGLAWNLEYYYRGCASWEWFYPYHYGPMMSDLVDLDEYLSEVSFDKGEPLSPFEQLLGCIPPSSADMLPKQYRWLMTSPKSPIVDFYPRDFAVDMNGKQYPWEAVALLPFIDSTRLADAVAAHVDTDSIPADVMKRNEPGEAFVFQQDESLFDPIPAVGSMEGFHEIKSSRTRTEIYQDVDWESDSKAPVFLPEILPGANLPYPGFPTLTEAPLQGLLRKKVSLNVFGTPSRYVTALVVMGDVGKLPPVERLAQVFVGTTVHFRYPHLQEGFVTAVASPEVYLRGNEKPKLRTPEEALEWNNHLDDLLRSYRSGCGRTGSGGWPQPHNNNNVTLFLRPLKGLGTSPDGQTVKLYSRREIEVPLSATLWSPTAPDPRFAGVPAMIEKDPYSAAVRSDGSENRGKGKDKRKATMFPAKETSKSTRGLQFGTKNHPRYGVAAFSSFATHHEELPRKPVLFDRIDPFLARSRRGFSSVEVSEVRFRSAARGLGVHQTPLLFRRPRTSSTSLLRGAGSVAMAALVISSAALKHAQGAQFGRAFDFPSPCMATKWDLTQERMFSSVSRGGALSPIDGVERLGLSSSSRGYDVGRRIAPTSIETPGAPPLQYSHGTTTIAFTFEEGIVAAVDSRASIGSFVGSKTVQKVIPISKHILGTMAGGAADCSFWIRKLRAEANLLELDAEEGEGRGITVARASRILANALYENRALQLSVGTMIMGFDYGGGKPSIYYVDNDGVRIRGDMFAVGSGSTFALGILDTERRLEMSEPEAVALAIKAIRHATFRDAYSGGFVGVYVITRDGWRKVFSQDLANISEA